MLINNEEHNDLCVGIDLGTTNSVLAIVNKKRNGDPVVKVVEVPRAMDIYSTTTSEAKLSNQRKATLPSCVYYREDRNFEPLVGDFAKRQYPLRPHLVAKSIKSQMGNEYVERLSPDIPDKTPAQVSSRILSHLLRQTESACRTRITDAIITVPANFDAAMCKATLDAAELAGITVKNNDGSERPILLSEPNAVIYDLINQMQDGDDFIDLTTEKNVLVFDLGGGTLDITIHKIRHRDEHSDVLKIDEIATNRYTLLGGDDFDNLIAEAMFVRYLNQYSKHPDIIEALKAQKNTIMPQLVNYAEGLKIDLNEKCTDSYGLSDDSWNSGWDDEEDEISVPVGGNIGGTNYAYDDSFTKDEIEEILSPFMGKSLKYDDYKKIDSITSSGNTRNIIYPILDVLDKAAKKLKIADFKVDAVIVNGGMSKFYLITDRLKEFFGFEPIVALDPDLAVARGAAFYHYCLHKDAQLQDDMRLVGTQNVGKAVKTDTSFTSAAPQQGSIVELGATILNDSLYLGLRNGSIHTLIPTGAELPYNDPEVQTGFELLPGQSCMDIPIKSRNIDGTYRTIANGKINFKRYYIRGVFVAFKVTMSKNKVIKMHAWTSRDRDGRDKIEDGEAVIEIGHIEKGGSTRISAPTGAILNAQAEISSLIQISKKLSKVSGRDGWQVITKMKAASSNICKAGNPTDFAEPVIDALNHESNDILVQRLFAIATAHAESWTAAQKKQLANICIDRLSGELHGFGSNYGAKIQSNINAIATLSVCADVDKMDKIAPLHNKNQYLCACIYAHCKTKTQLEWLYGLFNDNLESIYSGKQANLKEILCGIGIAFKNDGDNEQISRLNINKMVKNLVEFIKNMPTDNYYWYITTLMVLASICDRRIPNTYISDKSIELAKAALALVEEKYSEDTRFTDTIHVADKLLNGTSLTDTEEQILNNCLMFTAEG